MGRRLSALAALAVWLAVASGAWAGVAGRGPELRATCTSYTSEEPCVSINGCAWNATSSTCAAALWWGEPLCNASNRKDCETITAKTEDKENGMLACLWTAKSNCTGPAPSSSLSASPAAVPCANRSESFQACVLDSLPEQGCTYWSSGCQADWSVCYRMADSGSCKEAAAYGCIWTPYYPSPSPASSPSPFPSPAPSSGERDTAPAVWELWPVPELPADFFTNATEAHWWAQPEHHGHGISLLGNGASNVLCPALYSLLHAAHDNISSACTDSGICGERLPDIDRLAGLLAGEIDIPLDACEGCKLLEDLAPYATASIAISAEDLLSNLTGSIAAFDEECPHLVDGLLWVAKHLDFLPSPGAPVAAVVCPAAKALVAASPDFFTPAQLCKMTGGDAKWQHECSAFLQASLDAYNGSAAITAHQLCYQYLPMLFGSDTSPSRAPVPTYQPGINGPIASAQSASFSGYCSMNDSASAELTQQCGTADDADTCAIMSPGCRWSASCYERQCTAGDSACLQHRAALPICAPLVKAMVENSTASALGQVCTDKLGMCGAATSEPCLVCKAGMAMMVGSFASQRDYYAHYSSKYNQQSLEEMALTACVSAVIRLNSTRTTCEAVAAVGSKAFALGDAAAACAANMPVLCQELVGMGAVPPTAAGMRDWCYSMASDYGSLTFDGLMQQLRWRFSCDPDTNTCCMPTDASSVLASRLGIRGLVPLTEGGCTDLPGCMSQQYCYPSWALDSCRSFSTAAACLAAEQCQWYGNEQWGSCVDAALIAKCRRAGDQGGRTGCMSIQDDQGLPQCNYQHYCYLDWALYCDPNSACCQQPEELLAADAPTACANRTSDTGGDAVCDYEWDCLSSNDPCNDYINAATCNLEPSCVWRSYGATPWSTPSQGWCASLKDSCFDHRFDREACSSNPSCRAVPRCARSYCQPGDTCCLIHSETECKGTAGCAAGGWCGLAYSPCWNLYNNSTCTEQAGCEWYSGYWADGTEYGWCQVATDPCSPHSGSPVACAAVLDADRGIPVCRYQASCYDACRDCRDCMDAVAGLPARLAVLNGDTSKYAAAVADFCLKSGGDYWTCQVAFRTVAAHPDAASRPAALCKALYKCSDACMGALDLQLCSTDGHASGAVPASVPPAGTCTSSAACTKAQTCDTSGCTKLTQCDASTGYDAASCGGTCVSKCEVMAPLLETLNTGTCNNDTDCTGEGEACTPIAGRACRRSACDDATGAVVSEECAGFCTTGTAPSLVSARLTNDGRQILLRFDAAVSATSYLPSTIFAAGTAAGLGAHSVVTATTDPAELAVWLDYSATITVGAPIALLAKPAVVAWLDGRVVSGGGAVSLQAPASPLTPVAAISGPASLGAGCGSSSSAAAFDGSGSSQGAGRALTYTWSVVSAASKQAELAAAAAAVTGSRLVLPAQLVGQLDAGGYVLRLTVTNWLGASTSTDLTVAKAAVALPQLAILGGAAQTFSVSAGIRVQTAIELASVCTGMKVTYEWAETSGLLPQGAFNASKPNLVVKGPMPSVSGGAVLTFTLTATLEGAGSVTTPLTLTAQQSALMAVVAGPRGDVTDTQALVFSGTNSLDPDDASNRTPFSFRWACTATDPATQVSAPCFADPATAPDMGAARLEVPAGLLPAGDMRYRFQLTATKGARSDTAEATVHVLAGAAPTGKISRFCAGAAGCTSKLHSPTDSLRLVFALDDATLLPKATFRWASADVPLAAAASTTKQSLVLPPSTAAGAAVFTDGTTVVINVTATANGKSATASITVPIARRPACTAASCLAVSPASGATDTTAFVASASGFVADSALVYDFGVRLADGRSTYHARGAADPTFSFAPRVLEAGQHTLFVCARDPTGAQACSTATVTVTAAAAAPTAADVSAVASSLDTAVAAGSTGALLSAVRQLSAVAASGSADAQAAAASTAETAVGALSALAGDAGATVEDSLGAAAAASSLVSSVPTISASLADGALTVATSAVQTLTAAGEAVQASDLDPLLDLAGAAGPVLAQTGSSARRRLLQAATSPAQLAAALDALTRSFAVAAGAQSALLASMVAGEAASAGTGALVAAATVVDPVAGATSLPIGSSGATVSLPSGFAAAVPAGIQLRLAHSADASLLLTLITSSTASVPATTSAVGRALLAAAPTMDGALSVTVVSGVVNITASASGAGAVDVAVPLNSDYVASDDTTCLRLDNSGAWRSDGIALASASAGVAHCSLTATATSNQVLVVQYEPQVQAASPSPSPSPSPADNAAEVEKPKNKTAAMVGGIVGGVGGAVLLAGCVLAAIKLRGARPPAAGAAPAAAFPAELELSQPTSPLSPNTVAASPFLPAAHPAPYSAAHA
ncbi:receptor for egg jelly precursor [Chlorella sorokiniana]|uniref:Receptor for egg jelly n=1 Tax=Chlorella sorokiniana TaxID=3076 RepID=A0A2P6TT16_CHLSO|nr:receptor for egg jelly precursor [Chlorella sorokiniana]|eukprot:PRW57206.1 receptor for egg jelly precursor [Chlorella sorokiniana]